VPQVSANVHTVSVASIVHTQSVKTIAHYEVNVY